MRTDDVARKGIPLRLCAVALLPLVLAAADSSKGPRERSLVPCVANPGFTLSGIISGFAPGRTVLLALYASKQDFEKARFCRSNRFLAADLPPDSIRFAFANLPAGEYLIASFQDMDGDGAMTRGAFGVPKEPYRIYRPNYGIFGPKFDKCKFRLERDYDQVYIDFRPGNR